MFESFLALTQFWELVPFTQAQFTMGLIGTILLVLTFSSLSPDIVLICGVIILLTLGILDPSEALSGMSNEGMITVAVLFVVGAGVQQTGGVDWIATRLFGRPKTAFSAITRLVFPTMFFSAFMNNTPLVAMLIPAVNDLSRAQKIPVSKLMIPLSYAAILGGTCTLIGTSTNLVVQGMLIKDKGIEHSLGMFDITWVAPRGALRRRLCHSRSPLPASRSQAGHQHYRRSAGVHRGDVCAQGQPAQR